MTTEATPGALGSNDQLGLVPERESVDDALMIVESYGPWGADLNGAHRRQIVLSDEVLRLRGLYEMAVRGRAEMRAALRQERRAEELHEGCRMPMEQARALSASEAAPDWYARGQDWGLADALTNGQSGDWVLDDIARAFAAGAAAKTTMKVEISSDPEMLRHAMAAETEAALLRAALDQKHAEYEDLKRCAANNTRNQGLKIETLLRGINDARALIDPIWRHRMGAEQVREHVQRGLRCIDSAITDCQFTAPTAVHASDCAMHNAPAYPAGECDCGALGPNVCYGAEPRPNLPTSE